ncbi:hypothetical protein E4U23_003605 [Claviceps purpurea]|nr:hypothetical protein E4U51_003660 [Claviceps purpurea]KAG6247674.1 hypothetical protein E4U23_003605 [Claviceps purpurea]
MNSPASDSMYALQDVPGKGKGLVATRNIPKGTRILSEQALFTITYVTDVQERQRLISQQVDSLSNDQRDAFLSMHNVHTFNDTARRYLGIFQTNSLPAEGISTPYNRAICLQACRINHDCDNNVMYGWNDKPKRHTVHAIRDIDAGEELTIPYVLFLTNRESRQRLLKGSWDFTCSCRLCSLPDEQSQERDRKLEQIVRLGKLCDSTFELFPLRTLRYYHAQMCLYSELGREDCDSAKVYEFAAYLTITYGDLARARVFAEKAAAVWTTLNGSDSLYVSQFKTLASHAAVHILHGFSMEWKTAVDDIPKTLEPDDFENWLWKRQIPKGQGKPKSITAQSFFSGFVDLPFTRGFGANGPSKKLHCCLLGEIIGSMFLLHLGIAIEDIHGYNVPVHFYTKDRGKEWMPSQYQRGYTVAILDPLQYLFKDEDIGIRLEDPRMIKIFPLSLAKMLELNDLVRKFSIRQQNGLRTCHGCGTNAAASLLKRCGKCLSFWYCTKECQMAGWTTKAHKGDCKFLRDPDLRGLFLIRWDEVQDCVRFPLKVADEFF